MMGDKEGLSRGYDLLEVEEQLTATSLYIRESQNLTQAELAKLVGTSQANISKLENGKLNPTVAFLKKFARACDTKLNIYLR